MDEQSKKVIRDLLTNCHNIFVTSVDEDGFPFTKGMFKTTREGLRTHFFSTNLSSATAGRFQRNNKACIYFCDENAICGLTLVGTMRICQDAAHKEMLWREGDEMYYPLGVTDPDYIVYEFTAEKGTLWNNGKTQINIDEWTEE